MVCTKVQQIVHPHLVEMLFTYDDGDISGYYYETIDTHGIHYCEKLS